MTNMYTNYREFRKSFDAFPTKTPGDHLETFCLIREVFSEIDKLEEAVENRTKEWKTAKNQYNKEELEDAKAELHANLWTIHNTLASLALAAPVATSNCFTAAVLLEYAFTENLTDALVKAAAIEATARLAAPK